MPGLQTRFAACRGLLLCSLAGAASALAFAPVSCWPLQLLSMAWLFIHIQDATKGKAVLSAGWAFGFGLSMAGIYWLFIAMYRFGDMPAALALLALMLFALFLGGFTALALWLGWRLQQRLHLSSRLTLLLVLPACWALLEWLRGWFLTGFPWLSLGYAHVDSPLAGFAPLLGVYGLGWLASLLAGALAVLWLERKRPPLVLLCAPAILLLGLACQQLQFVRPHGQVLSVRLLQGNISQDIKFARERVIDSLQLYQRLILQERADLIATPETAFPLFAHMLPNDFLPGLHAWAREQQSHLLLGIPLADGQEHYTNSVLGLGSGTSGTYYRYDKQHLVPFGEFIPTGFRWFVDLMHIPLGDFAAGAELQAPFAVKDQWILPNICYEDLFGEEIAAHLGNSAAAGKPVPTILLNISNLAWYGESSAIPQHLHIARMRALESGRSMLRATNTGATSVIAPDGQVLQLLPYDQMGVLSAKVQGYTGLTPYAQYRNLPFLLLTVCSLGWAWLLRNGRGKADEAQSRNL